MQSAEFAIHHKGSRASELVFGCIDGLFSVLGIIAAAGSAELLPAQIFTTGLGGTLAGALSVFAAVYLSETTEKRSHLLQAIRHTNHQRAKNTNGPKPRTKPLTADHPKVRYLVVKINRKAMMSGLVTALVSGLSSLVLLVPLVMLPLEYAVNAAMILGVLLLLLLGAVRGTVLHQSPVKSAVKMAVVGIAVIVASMFLASFVLGLID